MVLVNFKNNLLDYICIHVYDNDCYCNYALGRIMVDSQGVGLSCTISTVFSSFFFVLVNNIMSFEIHNVVFTQLNLRKLVASTFYWSVT